MILKMLVIKIMCHGSKQALVWELRLENMTGALAFLLSTFRSIYWPVLKPVVAHCHAIKSLHLGFHWIQPLVFHFLAQVHQCRPIKIACDRLTRFQQHTIDYAELISWNVKHSLGYVTIRFGRRHGCKARSFSWFLALRANFKGPLFVSVIMQSRSPLCFSKVLLTSTQRLFNISWFWLYGTWFFVFEAYKGL